MIKYSVLLLFFLFCYSKKETRPEINTKATYIKAEQALTFCKAQNFNTNICILVDMSLHSWVKRFIVWNFKTKSIVDSFLVGHSCGDNAWGEDHSKATPKFSNADGSHLSSLGKYKIGARGYSNWGVHLKYFLHGLESTNSKAYNRTVVFHSWETVSDTETYPRGTPEGWGCPVVSNNSFKLIDPLIRKSSKPVLMWIYK